MKHGGGEDIRKRERKAKQGREEKGQTFSLTVKCNFSYKTFKGYLFYICTHLKHLKTERKKLGSIHKMK